MAKNKRIKNKKQDKPFDFVLFITVLLLLLLGIIMVLSASSPTALSTTGKSYTYVYKQLIAALIGVILMLLISKIDYKKYGKFYKVAYAISVIILLLVLVPGLGRTVNGARRWISIPIFTSVQPSEISKLGLILFFAMYLTINKGNLRHIWKGFFRPIIFFLVPPILILLAVQSHFSASIVIIAITSIMMIILREFGKRLPMIQ